MAAKLHHTNVMPIYATGEEHGTYYCVMELINGPSLDQVLRQLRVARTTAASVDADNARSRTPTTPFPPFPWAVMLLLLRSGRKRNSFCLREYLQPGVVVAFFKQPTLSRRLKHLLHHQDEPLEHLALIDWLLQSLPLATVELALAQNRLRDARRCYQAREIGAARYVPLLRLCSLQYLLADQLPVEPRRRLRRQEQNGGWPRLAAPASPKS